MEISEDDLITPDKPQAAAGKDEDTVTMTRAEAEALRRERDEALESEREWARIARQPRAAQPAAEEVEQDDPREFIDEEEDTAIEGDTPEKLVDEFAAKGVSALKSRGFITAADAKKLAAETALRVTRELIGRERTKMTSDATLVNEFPELKDQSSELFKLTAKHYQAAVAMDPSAKKTPAALYLAAKAAKAELQGATPARRPREDDDVDYEPEREGDRRRRADSQDGRPRARGVVEEPDDMLGDEARQVIRGFGITEEEFKASQKATSGAGRRRR